MMDLLSEIEKRVLKLKNERDELRNQIETLKIQFSDMLSSMEELKHSLLEVKKSLSLKEKKIEEVREIAERKEAHPLIFELNKKISELSDLINVYESRFRELDEKVEKLVNEFLSSFAKEVKEELKKEFSDIRRLEGRISDLGAEVAVVKPMIEHLNNEIRKLKRFEDKFAEKMERRVGNYLANQIKSLEKEVTLRVAEKLKKDIREVKQKFDELELLTKKVREIEELRKDLVKLEEKTRSLLASLKDLSEGRKAFETKVRDYVNSIVSEVEDKIAKINSIVLELSDRFVLLKKEVEKSPLVLSKNEILSVKSRVENLENKILEINNTLNKIETTLTILHDKTNKISEKVDKSEFIQNIKRVQDKISFLEDSFSSLNTFMENKFRELISEAKKLPELEKNVKFIADKFEKEVTDLKANNKNLLHKIEGLITSTANKFDELENKFNALEHQTKELETRIVSDSRKEIAKIEGRINGIESSFSELKNKLKNVEKEILELRSKDRELLNKINAVGTETKARLSQLESSNREEIAQIKERVKQFDVNLLQLKKNFTIINDILSNLSTIKKDLGNFATFKEFEKVLGKIDRVEEVTKDTVSKLSNLENLYTQLSSRMKSLEERMSNLERRVKENSKESSEIAELKKSLQEIFSILELLKRESKETKKEIGATRECSFKEPIELKDISKEVEKLAKSLKDTLSNSKKYVKIIE